MIGVSVLLNPSYSLHNAVLVSCRVCRDEYMVGARCKPWVTPTPSPAVPCIGRPTPIVMCPQRLPLAVLVTCSLPGSSIAKLPLTRMGE